MKNNHRTPFIEDMAFDDDLYTQTFTYHNIKDIIDKIVIMNDKIDRKVDDDYSYRHYQYNKGFK